MNLKKRRGVLLVFVLGTAMLIAVIGVSALLAARVEYRSANDEADAITALWCANAGLEVGRQHIAADADWRTARGGGAWYTNQSCGPGKFSLSVTLVPDADADPYNDPCVLTSTGQCGNTIRTLQLKLEGGWKVVELTPQVSTTPP
jgi:Tfp pilus assembly protein PilX